MEETRYMISDAAKIVEVEAHVLRYWEEELDLEIGRTELGHRYYTDKNIREFMNIKELKERGLQLKAIKVLLPQLEKKESRNLEEAYASYAVRGAEDDQETGREPEEAARELKETGREPEETARELKESVCQEKDGREQGQPGGSEESRVVAAAGNKESTAMAELDAQTQKLWQFERIAINAFKQALEENNKELKEDISDAIVREMDILMKLREEREEERYRRLDESIRAHQNPGISPRRMTAAAKEKKNSRFGWLRRH